MCRGCGILINNGQYSVDEYLSWLNEYENVIRNMKRLEKSLLSYHLTVDDYNQKKSIDKFRRALIRKRREYAKIVRLLDEV